MKGNISLAIVSTALIFAITLLYFSSSPIANPSSKDALQSWLVYPAFAIAATLLLSGILAGIARALNHRKHEDKQVEKSSEIHF